jgi:taurine dioxygenase
MQGSDYLAVKNGTKSIGDVVASAHPIVRVHPETGRKSLYMNPQVRMIEGMTADESQLLITYLSNVGTHQRNIYRHVWQEGDLVMWDNRCLLHLALADFDRGKIRHMERTTVRGHVSGHRYHGPVA